MILALNDAARTTYLVFAFALLLVPQQAVYFCVHVLSQCQQRSLLRNKNNDISLLISI